MIVPEAPAARLRGLPVVPVTTCVTVPVLVAVGGLGFETIVFWVTLELFITVILS